MHSFVTTRWSIILPAAHGCGAARESALESLCQTYWSPVYGLFRWWGHSPEDSRDLTQEFFGKLLERDWLRPIDQEGGKFRSYLFTLARRFRADEYDKATAAKRGGGLTKLSFDWGPGEEAARKIPALIGSPAEAFDRLWGLTVIGKALGRLEAECRASGKATLWPRLKPLLSAEPEHGECQTIAREAGLTSNHISVTLLRWRRRLRELVMDEVRDTVTDDSQTRDEFENLLAALRS